MILSNKINNFGLNNEVGFYFVSVNKFRTSILLVLSQNVIESNISYQNIRQNYLILFSLINL